MLEQIKYKIKYTTSIPFYIFQIFLNYRVAQKKINECVIEIFYSSMLVQYICEIQRESFHALN